MLMPDRQYNAATGYRYGFNGKEKSSEITTDDYDFGTRIYDGRIGRWLSLDPLQAKYPGESPYNFTGDNPILFIDPDGRDRIITHYTTVEFADGSTFLLTKTTVEKGVYNIYKGDDGKFHYSDIIETRTNFITGNAYTSGPGASTFTYNYRGSLDFDLSKETNIYSFVVQAQQVENAFKEKSGDKEPKYVDRGGIRFTSGKGGNNGGPYSTYTDIKSENIDLLISAIKGMMVTDLGVSHIPSNIPAGFQNALNILDNIQKIAAGSGTISKWVKETKKLIPEGKTIVNCPICKQNWKDSADNWVKTQEPAKDTIDGVVNETSTLPSETPLKKKN